MKSKKLLGSLLATMLCATMAQAQQHSLTRLWSTEANLPVPESVRYHAGTRLLYVSLIDGGPSERDGKGGIAKVGLNGKITNKNWVTGLNAPKGIGIAGNRMYVADMDEVVVINLRTGKVLEKIKIEGAKFLNDVTTNEAGEVYITDMETGNIHLVTNGKAHVYYKVAGRPNGLLALDNGLLILNQGKLQKLDNVKHLTTLVEGLDGSTDGIEEVSPGEYIVSCWAGVVYYVKTDGSKETLLDTREDKTNSADIGYDPVRKIVYVPTFMKNSVTAYRLK